MKSTFPLLLCLAQISPSVIYGWQNGNRVSDSQISAIIDRTVAAVKSDSYHAAMTSFAPIFAEAHRRSKGDLAQLLGRPEGGLDRGSLLAALGQLGAKFQSQDAFSALRACAQIGNSLAELQKAAGQEPTFDRSTPFGLSFAALRAYQADRSAEASVLARRVLEIRDNPLPPHGYDRAAHLAHTILGLIAVKDRSVALAKEHLLLSIKNMKDSLFSLAGPSFALAEQLLRLGEQGAVTEYLTLCASFQFRNPKITDLVAGFDREAKSGNLRSFGPLGQIVQ